MVERIEKLNKLSRVELIKLLNIDKMEINELLDLYIKVLNEMIIKHNSIEKIEFKNEYNDFYNLEMSNKSSFDKFVGVMDLLNFINIKDMDFCELLYLYVLVSDSIDEKYLKNRNFDFLNGSKMVSFDDIGICGFGKINFVNYNDLLYGVDRNYNFYVGKIDHNNNCLLFNILRKGIPDDLSNDILVFNGVLSSNNSLDGFWSVGSEDVSVGLKKLENMDNCFDNGNYSFDVRDLYMAFVACSQYTKTLDNLLNRIDSNRKAVKNKNLKGW
ncbi:MAG: hypothetical protein IKF19_01795 [Bacilli bacterium]|nr:hypothetical protein [Bacilli bacterium]